MDRSPSEPAPSAAPPRAEPADGAGASLLAPLLRPRLRGVPLLTLGLLAAALSLVLGNWLPTRAATAATQRALEEQRAENRACSDRIRVAEARAERLATDPWTHERFLRDELKMSRPGEVIVR